MRKKLAGNIIGFAVSILILALCGLLGGLTGVFEDISDISGVFHFNAVKIFKSILVFAFMYGLSSLFKIILGLIPAKKGRTKTMITVVASLGSYIFVLIAFCWVLTIIGVNVSTIFAGVGIFALIIGFGAESLVADLVTGMFILFENQFNVGDIIEVDGYRGSVDSIGIRTTCIRDAGDNLKIINNSSLKNILNRSEKGSVAIALVGVSYSTDLRKIDKMIDGMLEKIKNDNSDVFIGEVKYLGVEELADSSVVLKFKADVEEKNIFSGRRLLNKEIKCAFDDAGIEIAFPQIDVHMRKD